MAGPPSDVLASLRGAFPDLFSEAPDPSGVLVPAASHVALATFLQQELGFTLYVTVVASHWPAEAPAATEEDPEPVTPPDAFEVATVLRQPVPGGSVFHWRVRLEGEATIPTLVPLFAGADWQEREQYDLVGVVFEGHPDMRRLMMPDDWVGHPLRKDFAIDTRCAPWR